LYPSYHPKQNKNKKLQHIVTIATSTYCHCHCHFSIFQSMAITTPQLFTIFVNTILPVIAILVVMLAVGVFFIVTYSRFVTHNLRPAIRRWFQGRRFLTPNNDVESQSTTRVRRVTCTHIEGLEKSVINAIPKDIYDKSKGEESHCDCTVCLDEFEESDHIRTLPLCSHSFHVVCIDPWLSKQPSCPLCRSCLRCALRPIMAGRIGPSVHHDHLPFQNDDEDRFNGYNFPRSSSSSERPATPYPHLRGGTSVFGERTLVP
jgi:E3 ubiquitin-protein ligase RNF38/44